MHDEHTGRVEGARKEGDHEDDMQRDERWDASPGAWGKGTDRRNHSSGVSRRVPDRRAYFCTEPQRMEPKLTSDSYSETTNMVLPNDANTMGNLFGGQLLKWLDMSCAISAHRHSKKVAVTAAVNNVSFDVPIKLGDLVTIKAHVSRTFNTSMEVWADVWIENQVTGEMTKCNSAIYTFVALTPEGRPTPYLQ